MQAWGLELLIQADQKQAAEDRDFEIGKMLVASGDYLPTKVFPEIFGESVKEVQAGSPEAEAAYARGDVVEDLTDIKWESPSDTSEQEVMADLEAFSRAMAENTVIAVEEDGGEWL